MFDNIGQKIKSVAIAVLSVGIIVSVIFGFITMFSDESMSFFGIFIIVIGSILSWVCALMTYGFGHLIENSDKLVAQNSTKTNSSNKPKEFQTKVTIQENNSAHKWRCEKCGNMISESTCPHCASLDYKICNYCKKKVPLDQERCECGCINFS